MDLDKSINRKSFLLYAIILIALGVALGAIGAHSLEKVDEIPIDKIDSWKTGVLYQLLMGVGIILVILMEKIFRLNSMKSTLVTLSIGVSLFSFSIYVLVLNNMWKIDSLKKIMIPLTPIGGVLMIVAWVLLLIAVVKKK